MIRFQPIKRCPRSVPRVVVLLALLASMLFAVPTGVGAQGSEASVSPGAVALCVAYESVVAQAAGDSLDGDAWLLALAGVEKGLDDIGPSPAGLYLVVDELRLATETPIVLDDGSIFVGIGYLNGVCNIVRGPSISPDSGAPTTTTPPATTPPTTAAPTAPTTDTTTPPAPDLPDTQGDVIPPPIDPVDDRQPLCSAYYDVLLLTGFGQNGSSEIDPVAWIANLDQLEQELDNIGPSPAGLYATIDALRAAPPITPILLDGEVFVGMSYLDAICFPDGVAFVEVDETRIPVTGVCLANSVSIDPDGTEVGESSDVFISARNVGVAGAPFGVDFWIRTSLDGEVAGFVSFLDDDILYPIENLLVSEDGLSGAGFVRVAEPEFNVGYQYNFDITCDEGVVPPAPSSFVRVQEILRDGSLLDEIFEIRSVCVTTPVVGAQDIIISAYLAETDAPPIVLRLAFDEGFRGADIVGFDGLFVSATDPATDFPEDFFLNGTSNGGEGTLFNEDGSAIDISFFFESEIGCDETQLPFEPPTDPGLYNTRGDGPDATGGQLFATCANLTPSGQYTIRTDVDGPLVLGGPEVGNYLVLHPAGDSFLIIGYDSDDQAQLFMSPDEMTFELQAEFYITLTGVVRTFSAFGDTVSDSFLLQVLLASVGRCNTISDISDDEAPGVGMVLMDDFADFASPEFDGSWDVFFACVDESEGGSSFLYELVIDSNPNGENIESTGPDEVRTATILMTASDGSFDISLMSGDSSLGGNVALDITLATDTHLVGRVQNNAVTIAFWVPIVGPRCV